LLHPPESSLHRRPRSSEKHLTVLLGCQFLQS
jgi:hypothetical protein